MKCGAVLEWTTRGVFGVMVAAGLMAGFWLGGCSSDGGTHDGGTHDGSTQDAGSSAGQPQGGVQTGGSSDGTPSPTPDGVIGLEDTIWKLKRVGGNPVIPGEREASLQLTPGPRRAVGMGGVNRYSAGYTLEGQSLTFTAAIMTKMAGPAELMTQEDRFMEALTATRSFRISGEQLELLGADGAVLAVFERSARLPL